MQNIREMAVLSRELLTLETSDVDTSHLMLLIYVSCDVKIHPGVPDQPLDELIECLRAARKRRPDLALEGHIRARVAMAWCLVCRYQRLMRMMTTRRLRLSLDEIIADTYPPGTARTNL
jgi:hypothetical protein